MRIVAGFLGGRTLKAPKGTNTRPTADRVREATFSRIVALLGDLSSLTALDAYAGSGAMGLEALSRGAAHVTFIEQAPSAVKTLKQNVTSLGVSSTTTVIPADVTRAAAHRHLQSAPYGLLILDPPYRIENAEVREVIGSLGARHLLASACLLVWEHATDTAPDPGPGWLSLGTKTYGTTAVTIFQTDSES